MILHKDDLYKLYEAIGEMSDPCVGVIQFAIHGGEVCRIEKDGDYIWFSLWEGSLKDHTDLEPIELAQMAAKYGDSPAWTGVSRLDTMEAMRQAGQAYIANESRDCFMKLCHAIVAYYKEDHHNDPGLFHIHDQACEFLAMADAAELDTLAIERGWWEDDMD